MEFDSFGMKSDRAVTPRHSGFSPFLSPQRSRRLAMARVRLLHAARRSSSCKTQSATITATLMSRIRSSSYLRICIHLWCIYLLGRVGRPSGFGRCSLTDIAKPPLPAQATKPLFATTNTTKKSSLRKKKREVRPHQPQTT